MDFDCEGSEAETGSDCSDGAPDDWRENVGESGVAADARSSVFGREGLATPV